ncbi:MAG: hypothetical protein IJY62_01350 [Clostridia bacterium]|nr:hypothetical protein [Clostridia bacterium]
MNVKGQTSISNEMTAIMARIVMSAGKRENVAIATEFGKLIDRVAQIETGAAGLSSPEKAISAEIRFTKEERRGMLPAFRREFEAAGSAARVIKRQSGQKRVNKRYVYEIRYRRNGYKIEVSSTDINEAKRKFIQATLGDSSERLVGRVYTHFPDEFMKEQNGKG